MEAFGLGPLPQGWEAKIEPKTGRIYFINHPAKSTTWEDPRLNLIPTPPYHIAVTQPTAYFEDTGGSRWSSPVPSLRGFSLHRRGSSPRLGGSPRIAPSPIPAPRNLRNEQQQVILGGAGETSTEKVTSSSDMPAKSFSSEAAEREEMIHQLKDEPTPGPSGRGRTSSIGNASHNGLLHNNNGIIESFLERPQSARSYASTSFSGHGIPSSFLSNCDTETGFRAVCALFPTAGEPHIRHLFHKYHNRATLVVSALQVEKHPFVSDVANQLELKLSAKDEDTDTIASIGETKSLGVHSPFKANSTTTGSPARTGTPVSLLKFSNAPSSTGSIHTRWGSPMLSLSPQLQMVKEESQVQKSPKMKLKYLKGIFPAADETFLLDVLSSCENNVQKASEKMLKKGFTRTPPAKPARQKWLEVKLLIEKRNKALEQQRVVNQLHIAMGEPVESPFPTPIMKPARPHLSDDQKEKVKRDLIKRFSDLPDRFVSWAAEAAKFDVEKAARLLQEVGPETPDEFKPFVVSSPANEAPGSFTTNTANRDRVLASRDDAAERRTVVRFAESPNTKDRVISSFLESERNAKERLSLHKLTEVGSSLDIDTPDSGYFELEKTRKKSFISSLFGTKQDKEKEFVSSSKIAKGPNSTYVKGSNPSLLQPNYIPARGPSSINKGPSAKNRVGTSGNALGPNPALVKGSMWGNRKNSPNNQHRGHHVAVGGC